MPKTQPDPLDDFDLEPYTHAEITRPVYHQGQGPAVLVVHEMPGITPEVADFGRRVARRGFHVAMPSLFGEPGKPMGHLYTARSLVDGCVRREFAALARRQSSPVTAYLRALARTLHATWGGPGVGFVGMCFTGNFGLAMMAEPAVLAPVLSQPSLPLVASPSHARALHVSERELTIAKRRAREERCGPLALRFTGDKLVPRSRFDALRAAFGDDAELIEIDSAPGNPHGIQRRAHSVLTLDLVDEDGHPTQAALLRVLELFDERLRPGQTPP